MTTADRKAQYLDAAQACHPVMTEFMHYHQGTQCNDERQYGMQQVHDVMQACAAARAIRSCSSRPAMSVTGADDTLSITRAIN